ncbi:hypothetical protein [Pseudomonas putida]|uniref:hypothetical protein n=1 Tax=Pseudomonas putida TaxID=303 RepID=UPI003D334175
MNKPIKFSKLRWSPLGSVEILIWMAVPALMLFRQTYVYGNDAIDYFVQESFGQVIIATLFVLFPIFFKQIFSSFPLEFLLKGKAFQQASVSLEHTAPPRAGDGSDGSHAKRSRLASGTDLLFDQAESSRNLARSIYGRAGVYLLLGTFVAFSGLAFFYVQTPVLNEPGQLIDKLLLLAPKFGILFFIEFVAFFFLRQYRSAMDEFRYYESIARRREEVSALLILSAESEPKINLMELLKSDCYFSKVSALEKDQSTEILEARKLEKGELELLGKVVESVVKAKG